MGKVMGTRMFQQSGGHLRILDCRRMTLGKFIPRDSPIFFATIQNLVARDL
jgi:hypothetical protein